MKPREQALNLLARREHSRAELERKLARLCPPEADPIAYADEIAALLDDLERENLLSNMRYAQSLAHARAGRHGSLRVRADLAGKGVPEAAAAEALAAARASDLASARAVWRKRFGVMPDNAAERARQMRFLAGRGFPGEVIRQVLGGAPDDAGEET